MRLACLCLGLVTATAKVSLGLDTQKSLAQYIHQTWDVNDGLPQLTGNAIAQTSRGYIWVGTQEGLSRFDGVNFTTFVANRPDEMTNDEVTALEATLDGKLWIGTLDGVLAYDSGHFKAYRAAEGLLDPRITSLATSADGVLWVGTRERGLFRFDGKSFETPPGSAKLAEATIRTVFVDSKQRVWAATDTGLALIDGIDVRMFSTRDGLPDNLVNDICDAAEGGVWIATENGLARFVEGAPLPVGDPSQLSDTRLTHVLEDQDGNVWLGTTNGGLNVYRNSTFESYSIDDPRRKIKIEALYEDRENNLWIGTGENGVTMLRDGPVKTFSTIEGLAAPMALGIVQGRLGNIWVGGPSGLTRIQGDEASVYKAEHGLPGDFIVSLYKEPSGDIWAGTRHSGLARFRYRESPKKGKTPDGAPPSFQVLETLTTEDGLSSNAVYAAQRDNAGRLWIGTNGEGLNILSDEGVQTFSKKDGLTDDKVTTIIKDAKGDLWVGTDFGLNWFGGGLLESHEVLPDLAEARVMHIHDDYLGRIWIGTYGQGLFVIDQNVEVQSIRKRDGLFDDVIFVILDDGQGSFWMSCNKGVFRVRVEALNAFVTGNAKRIESTIFDVSDGMRQREATGSFKQPGWVDNDGNLWFSTVDGVVRIDPLALNKSEFPPKTVIETVHANGRPVKPGSSLPPDVKTLDFTYTGISFVSSNRIEFIYKLVGIDDKWISAGTQRRVNYTNLPPGNYEFRVKARSADGAWSRAAARFPFSLNAAFYETTWFYITAFIVLLFFLFSYSRWRAHRVETRERKLSELAWDRTRQALESQIGEVQRVSDKLSGIADALGSFMSDLASSSAQVAKVISEIVMTLHTMEKAGSDVQKYAGGILNDAKNDKTKAFNSREEMKQTSGIIVRIRDDSKNIATGSRELLESLVEVNRSIRGVKEIAEKSKILAVNASIEAVKAGRYGVGFGVVAREIKAMALQSKNATQSITNLLFNVQRAIVGINKTSKAGQELSVEGVKQIEQASRTVSGFVEAMSSTSDKAQKIAGMIGQQSEDIGATLTSMKDINYLVQENELLSRDMKEQVSTLNDSAKELLGLVANWKAPETLVSFSHKNKKI